MARLNRKRILLGKAESVYGTDAVPTITNAIVCGDITLNGIEAAFAKRNIIKPYLGSAGSVKTNTKGSVKFGVEVAGSGAAGTAPAYGALLRACGLAETVNAGVSVEYAPVSEGFESATIYGHDDGLLYKLLGARGTVDMQLAVGDIPMFTFDFQGLYGGTPTVAANPSGTLPNYLQPVAVTDVNSSLITLNGSTYTWQTCTVTLGNTVQHTPLVGREEVVQSDRNTIAKIVLELSASEERAMIQLVEAGTLVPFQVVHGTTAGNIIQIDGPTVQLTNPSRQELNGMMLMGFDLEMVPDAGNDELLLTIK